MFVFSRKQTKIILVFSANAAVTLVYSSADDNQPDQKHQSRAERNRQQNGGKGARNLAVAVFDFFRQDQTSSRNRQPDIKNPDARRDNSFNYPLPTAAGVIDICQAAQDVPCAVSDRADDKDYQKNPAVTDACDGFQRARRISQLAAAPADCHQQRQNPDDDVQKTLCVKSETRERFYVRMTNDFFRRLDRLFDFFADRCCLSL